MLVLLQSAQYCAAGMDVFSERRLDGQRFQVYATLVAKMSQFGCLAKGVSVAATLEGSLQWSFAGPCLACEVLNFAGLVGEAV